MYEAFERVSEAIGLDGLRKGVRHPKWFQKIVKGENYITKKLRLVESVLYFNCDSEQYIPSVIYNKTKMKKYGIFEAISPTDLRVIMKR